MKETFFDRGNFPAVVQNGTDAIILTNPWVNGTKAAPFDQREFESMHFSVVLLDLTLFIY